MEEFDDRIEVGAGDVRLHFDAGEETVGSRETWRLREGMSIE
jgi:hypothetical protein